MKARELAFKNINRCLCEEPSFCGGAWAPQGGALTFLPHARGTGPSEPGVSGVAEERWGCSWCRWLLIQSLSAAQGCRAHPVTHRTKATMHRMAAHEQRWGWRGSSPPLLNHCLLLPSALARPFVLKGGVRPANTSTLKRRRQSFWILWLADCQARRGFGHWQRTSPRTRMVTYSTAALGKERTGFCHAPMSHGYIQHFWLPFSPTFIPSVFDFVFYLILFFALYSFQNETSMDIPGHNHFRCKKDLLIPCFTNQETKAFWVPTLLGQNQNVACIFHTKPNFWKERKCN